MVEKMANNNNRQHRDRGERGERNQREFFTLGEHAVGAKHYRFRYDGRTYQENKEVS